MLENATITGGKYITAGVTIGFGNHHKTFQDIAGVPYKPRITEARRWYVLLYDTDEKRAWLEDGATALLQITTGQLQGEWLREVFQPPRVGFTNFFDAAAMTQQMFTLT